MSVSTHVVLQRHQQTQHSIHSSGTSRLSISRWKMMHHEQATTNGKSIPVENNFLI